MKMLVVLAALLGLSTSGTLQPESKVWVDGTSTVRSFKCSAASIGSKIDIAETSNINELVTGATITIPVAKLDCGNGTMNGHMAKALKADKNTDIEFKLNSYKVDGVNVTLNGTLTMAGVTKDIAIPGTIQKDDVVRVKASVPLKMTEWGIKPPSLMLGTMKVRENVTVGFDVTLKP